MPDTPNPPNPPNLPSTELRQLALFWLAEPDPYVKAAGVKQLALDWQQGRLQLEQHAVLASSASLPGRLDKPSLVPPRQIKPKSCATLNGRATLIHALAHIELNAINLALDAVWRFADLPRQYYLDWLRVAQEEALHFTLLAQHLTSLGYAYGDFKAHNALWEMAERTTGDVLARMALVPRTLEARGLDANPAIRTRLAEAGDQTAAEILDIILRDEIGHVTIGNRWYETLCQARGLDPLSAAAQLAEQYQAPKQRGPFNLPARRAAGFGEAELQRLQQEADALAAQALAAAARANASRAAEMTNMADSHQAT
jgi:uncharacterized ferritin-like protein (DUF455 family)